MNIRRLIPHLSVIAILLASIAVCAFTTKGRFDSTLPVKMQLPQDIGEYHGYEILNCQNEECLKHFDSSDLTNKTVCPVCGGKLDSVSLAEYRLLPRDTIILHRAYRRPSGQPFMVAVVIGGHERRSIHKPQVCIVGQGNTINGQRLIKIPVSRKTAADVMLLEVNRSKLYFAYWFTDGTHETARHLVRLFLTAWDGIIRNERRRWAYISVAAPNNSSQDSLSELKDFIAKLYPAINRGDL